MNNTPAFQMSHALCNLELKYILKYGAVFPPSDRSVYFYILTQQLFSLSIHINMLIKLIITSICPVQNILIIILINIHKFITIKLVDCPFEYFSTFYFTIRESKRQLETT